MGKGSSPAPAPVYQPTPMEQANAQMILQKQQQDWEAQKATELREREDRIAAQQKAERDEAARIAKEEKAAAEAKAAQAELDRKNKSNQKFQTTYNTAAGYAGSRLAELGIDDKYGIGQSYLQGLDRWKNDQDVDNFSGGYDYAGMFDNAFNTAQGRERGKQQQTYGNLTNPGWETGYFADTADDSILDAILGEQFTAASDQLTTAQKRGSLTDGNLAAATGLLGNKKKAANSTLQSLGGGILSGYRSQLANESKSYSDRLANWKIGDTFNADMAKAGLDSLAGSLSGRMEGDIRAALGDTQLFDTSGILGTAGIQGGASNALAAAFVNNSDKATTPEEKNRLTGTTGVF